MIFILNSFGSNGDFAPFADTIYAGYVFVTAYLNLQRVGTDS